ncbi:MAG: hypothetical protein JWM95_4287 [Gemmatimonadetes bacterium]|nr:hypothetical protein [Gemmatimonadota bacterium]
MRDLVLVHGRSQQGKDPAALKAEWLCALEKGLQKSGLTLPIPENRVHFPYYGQALFDLDSGVDPGQIAEIIVKGRGNGAADMDERKFITAALEEAVASRGISEDEVFAEAAAAGDGAVSQVIERGPLNWRWVQGLLRVIDRRVPGGSAATLAAVTSDVFRFLKTFGVRDIVELGVQKAMPPDADCVVVSHSLGTVVAYSLLRREGTAQRWHVPLFVTLGSPLGVTKIRASLAPVTRAACIGSWFNAMDPRDVVALYPLDVENFPMTPPIENKTDVDNWTDNRHGIAGYLEDAEVARRIHEALVAP